MELFAEKVKLLYIILSRKIKKIFFLVVPIKKNRVIFESFSGDGYSCNPKYISERLKEKYKNIEIVWAVKNQDILPKNVVFCKYRSFKHFILRISSKVYVCNFLQAVEIPKRKKQIEIQTWHGGGCYKKVGNEEKARSSVYDIRLKMHIQETDYFIASSEYWEEEVMRKQFGYTGKALEIGMPRNDCLIGDIDEEKKNLIRKQAGIDIDAFAVLYAPTWREGLDKYETINYKEIQKAFEKRFRKKCQVLFRAHLYGKEQEKSIVNLTNYPDMQELLYACDALITDYSSSMWDFSLTAKPCFLYVPDLQRYIDQRGFDKDINTWGFPVCQSNTQLVEQILTFDEKDFKMKMDKHQKELKTFEDGNATEKVVDLIAHICGVE